MGDGFFAGCLNRLFRQLVAQLASAPALVELDVFKMTQVTAGFADLEFLLIADVLVAGGAVDLLALDLVLFVKMRFVNEGDFLSELDFFSFEFIKKPGFAVTVSSF